MSEYFSNDTWLMERLGRFTASEVHKLFVGGKKKDEFFGKGAQTYIRQKAAEIITCEVKQDVDFKQAEWGKANEPEACKAFEEALGVSGSYYGVANPKFFPSGEHAGGSPDWESDSEGADFKCPFNSDVHLENLLINSVEEYIEKRWEYYCQGQANMHTRGWKQFYAVSYDPRMPLPLQLKIIAFGPDATWVKEYEERIYRAGEEKLAMIDMLTSRSVMIAQRDEEIAATIIEPVTA